MPSSYQPPVSQLLTHGAAINVKHDQWFDYVSAYHFTPEHIPDLLRLACTPSVDWDDDEAWDAPIHAWRTLGQLKAEAAIEPLIALLEDEEDNDFLLEDLPTVFGMIGPACIPILTRHLAESDHPESSQITAVEGLAQIPTYDASYRDECVQHLSAALANYQQQTEGLNGFIVSSLIKLKATEAIDLIEQVYKDGPMDEWICGSIAQVKIYLGLAKKADFTPEELEAKMPENIKQLRKTLALFDQVIAAKPARDRASSPPRTVAETIAETMKLKSSSPAKSKSGFGQQKPQQKKKKKKR